MNPALIPTAPLPAVELQRLGRALLQPAALIELAVLAGCVLLAGLLAWLAGRRFQRGTNSTLFGERIVDGALFPALALALALLANALLQMLWPGAVPPAVFRVALPVLASLALIRLAVRVLRAAFPRSPLMRMAERSLSWLAWIAVVLWITGLLPLLLNELDTIGWKVGASRISVRNILEGAVSAVLVLMLALWLSSALEARLLRADGAGADNLSLRKIAANALRAVLLLVGLMFALSAAGIDLTALGVLGGALGVGIGLGLQKLASNYVSGFVILAERSVRIGDMVKVDNFEGRISDITTRYTVIRSLNGRKAIVPNEMLVTQRVENLSQADPHVALSTSLRVAHGTDLEALMPQLLQAVAAVPRVLAQPPPGVQLMGLGADGLALEVGFWIGDPANGTASVLSGVNLALLRTINAAQVRIALPQQVLHGLPPAAA